MSKENEKIRVKNSSKKLFIVKFLKFFVSVGLDDEPR